MDKTLERVLSLLPKKEDGSFAHGAKKEFAQKIGYSSGEIVSMWIKGSSSSYKTKLHEIAMKYNVSVAWLEGKTDVKKPGGLIASIDNDPFEPDYKISSSGIRFDAGVFNAVTRIACEEGTSTEHLINDILHWFVENRESDLSTSLN